MQTVSEVRREKANDKFLFEAPTKRGVHIRNASPLRGGGPRVSVAERFRNCRRDNDETENSH